MCFSTVISVQSIRVLDNKNTFLDLHAMTANVTVREISILNIVQKNTSGCTSIPKKSLVSVEGDRRLIDLSDKNKFAAWLERISDVIACVKQIEKHFLFYLFVSISFYFQSYRTSAVVSFN